MKYTIALMTAMLSIAGCTEDPPEEYDRIVTSTLLNGTWNTGCVIDGTNSYLPVLTFASTGGKFYDSGTGTSSTLYHTDNTTCSTFEPEVLDLSTFSYTLKDEVTVDGSVAELSEAMQIDTVNTTEGSVNIGAEEYDIFGIKDKYTLYFGDKSGTNDGSTTDLRPLQLTDTNVFTK